MEVGFPFDDSEMIPMTVWEDLGALKHELREMKKHGRQ